MLKRLLCAAAVIALPSAASANPVSPVLHPPFTLAQQTPPSEKSDPVVVFRHAPPGLSCDVTPGRVMATEAFVKAYTNATFSIKERRFEDALAAVEIAATHAKTYQEWTAVENVRIAAFNGLDRPRDLLASLEAIEAIGCDKTNRNRDAIRGLRNQLGLPPQ